MKNKIYNSWLAGFWEGEGCLGKHKESLGYYIEIKQSLHLDRNVESCMKKIQKTFGGYLHIKKPQNKNHRIILSWRLNKQYNVMQFIKAIYPCCHFRKNDLRKALIYFVKCNIKKDIDIKVLKKLRQEDKSHKIIAEILKIPEATIQYRLQVDKCLNFWVNIIALQNILSAKILEHRLK